MLPKIDKQAQVALYLKANPQQARPKPKSAKPKIWDQNMTLDSYTTPQFLVDEKYKKCFKMRIYYTDHKLGKSHTQTIYFGSKSDFIFSADQKSRLQTLLKLKDIDNPLSPDYWTAHLCNKRATLKEALDDFNEFFMAKLKSSVQKKIKK